MPRRKKPEPPTITTAEQAKNAMAQLATHHRELQILQTRLNEQIDQVKSAAAAKSAGINQGIKRLEQDLTAYATHNRETLFKKRKSIDTLHGVFGFRKSTALKTLTGQTWTTVLEKLQSLGKKDAITVKESVNKETLHKWDDSALEAVGARRVSGDQFYYEIAEEALAD